MAQYIDKDALIAEIQKLKCKIDENSSYGHGWHDGLRMGEFALDALEVKEVDLEKEISSYIQDNSINRYFRVDTHDMAEHFFELGLKAKG